jgi:hypothetical protein
MWLVLLALPLIAFFWLLVAALWVAWIVLAYTLAVLTVAHPRRVAQGRQLTICGADPGLSPRATFAIPPHGAGQHHRNECQDADNHSDGGQVHMTTVALLDQSVYSC